MLGYTINTSSAEILLRLMKQRHQSGNICIIKTSVWKKQQYGEVFEYVTGHGPLCVPFQNQLKVGKMEEMEM